MLESRRKRRSKTKYSAPALEKGLDILELLSREPEGLTVSGIARQLNRSVSELFRMLMVLEQRGYVHSPPDSDKYLLTLKMFELAYRFRPVQRLTTVAAPIMRRLAFRIEQSCHLVIYYEGKGHVVVQQDSPSERLLTVRLGAEAPLIDSCSGHLLLAYADEDERSAMIAKIPKHHRKPTRLELDAVVARVLKNGFEVIDSAQIAGVRDIGYPVFDHTGSIIAALVVPFFSYLDNSHRVDFESARLITRDAAHSISRALGYNEAA